MLHILIVTALLVSVQGRYESMFCNQCPLDMRVWVVDDICERVKFNCTCDCSFGCQYDLTKVSKGFTVSGLDIKQVTDTMSTCDACLVLWSSWQCYIHNPSDQFASMIFDVCDLEKDYKMYSHYCNNDNDDYQQDVPLHNDDYQQDVPLQSLNTSTPSATNNSIELTNMNKTINSILTNDTPIHHNNSVVLTAFALCYCIVVVAVLFIA
jgi:hypothetical protein